MYATELFTPSYRCISCTYNAAFTVLKNNARVAREVGIVRYRMVALVYRNQHSTPETSYDSGVTIGATLLTVVNPNICVNSVVFFLFLFPIRNIEAFACFYEQPVSTPKRGCLMVKTGVPPIAGRDSSKAAFCN